MNQTPPAPCNAASILPHHTRHHPRGVRTNDVHTLWPFPYEAAIFDFDGTVADSLDVWHRVDTIFFEKRGITYAPDYPEKLSALGFEEGARYTIETYGLSDSVQEVCDEWNALGKELYRTDVELRPGAAEYIAALHRRGIPVGLATTNRPEVIEAMEDRVPLGELFPVRVHGCQVEHSTKNHPDIYLECARRLGVRADRCAVFEDLPVALMTARRIGMTTIGVLTGATTQRVDQICHASDIVIEDWQPLAQLIASE